MFAESAIKGVRVPSTLREIDAYTFFGCKDLEVVELSEGLEVIEAGAFAESGIRSIVLPASTMIVCGAAFGGCEQLRSVRLNEELKVLGAEDEYGGTVHEGEVFIESALESIAIPSTVEIVGRGNFNGCKKLKRI